MRNRWLTFLCACLFGGLLHAAEGDPAAQFLAAHGAGQPGQYWLDEADRRVLGELLGHPPAYLRMRYWPVTNGTAWVMDEIGKEKPITLGIVVQDHAVAAVQVLQYRESRGGEVRYPFFTRQFLGARLAGDALDRSIDGISGATLSVRAVRNVVRVALYLDARLAAAAP